MTSLWAKIATRKEERLIFVWSLMPLYATCVQFFSQVVWFFYVQLVWITFTTKRQKSNKNQKRLINITWQQLSPVGTRPTLAWYSQLFLHYIILGVFISLPPENTWSNEIRPISCSYRLSIEHYLNCEYLLRFVVIHYCDVIMVANASQITSLTVVYSTVYSGADQHWFQACAQPMRDVVTKNLESALYVQGRSDGT